MNDTSPLFRISVYLQVPLLHHSHLSLHRNVYNHLKLLLHIHLIVTASNTLKDSQQSSMVRANTDKTIPVCKYHNHTQMAMDLRHTIISQPSLSLSLGLSINSNSSSVHHTGHPLRISCLLPWKSPFQVNQALQCLLLPYHRTPRKTPFCTLYHKHS